MVRGFPEVGDLLITTEAPLGETAQITEAKVALAQRVILLKAYEDRIANNYLKFYFSSAAGAIELWTRATGSTAIGIKAYHLKEVRVTVPPIDEQIVIADRLDREIVGIDTLVARVRNGIERLKEYRSALISAAVTGKIDVREEISSTLAPWRKPKSRV